MAAPHGQQLSLPAVLIFARAMKHESPAQERDYAKSIEEVTQSSRGNVGDGQGILKPSERTCTIVALGGAPFDPLLIPLQRNENAAIW